MPQGVQDYSHLNLAAKRTGLTEQVQEALVDMILEDVIPDDAPIRIDALADALNVSATPVREALARLEGLGLQKNDHSGIIRYYERLADIEVRRND